MTGFHSIAIPAVPHGLRGQLHPVPPNAAAARDTAVLWCRAIGSDDHGTDAFGRDLARHLSALGVAVLRFDYTATGESAGAEIGDDPLGLWLADIDAAADTLRRQSGATRLLFAGLRLGATLATLAAARRGDVAGLVALAPVVSGRAFVREARMLQPASAGIAPDWIDGSDLRLSPAALQQLGAVNLAAATVPAVPRVLLLDPDDRVADTRWAPQLRALGVALDQHAFRADAVWDGGAASAALGGPLRQTIAAWVADGSRPLPQRPAAGPFGDVLRLEADGARCTECAVCIETPGEAPLHGILTEPGGRPGPLAVLVMNTGAGRRTGPSRFNVLLARQLAARGITTLRLDHSGVGDSPPAAGAMPSMVYPPAGPRDAERAAAFLRQLPGIDRCVGTGICSSGYHALRAAFDGAALDRVVAINLVLYDAGEALAYDATMARLRAAAGPAHAEAATAAPAPRAQATGWQRRTGALLRSARRQAVRAVRATDRALPDAWRFGAGRALRAALRRALERGLDLHFVFGPGEPGLPLLLDAGGARLRRGVAQRRLGIHRVALPEADHVLSRSAARAVMLAHVTDLIARPMPRTAAAPAPAAAAAAAAPRARRPFDPSQNAPSITVW